MGLHCGVIVGGLFLLLVSIGIACVRTVREVERIEWNRGVCARSGRPWVLTGSWSMFERVYSDGVGNTLVLDWYKPKEGQDDAASVPHSR